MKPYPIIKVKDLTREQCEAIVAGFVKAIEHEEKMAAAKKQQAQDDRKAAA